MEQNKKKYERKEILAMGVLFFCLFVVGGNFGYNMYLRFGQDKQPLYMSQNLSNDGTLTENHIK